MCFLENVIVGQHKDVYLKQTQCEYKADIDVGTKEQKRSRQTDEKRTKESKMKDECCCSTHLATVLDGSEASPSSSHKLSCSNNDCGRWSIGSIGFVISTHGFTALINDQLNRKNLQNTH